MKLWTVVVSIALALGLLAARGGSTGLAYGQDAPGDAAADMAEAEAPSREVVEAWATPLDLAGEVAAADAAESDAFARIHDADEERLRFEEAQRMVGFDLLDGVR